MDKDGLKTNRTFEAATSADCQLENGRSYGRSNKLLNLHVDQHTSVLAPSPQTFKNEIRKASFEFELPRGFVNALPPSCAAGFYELSAINGVFEVFRTSN